MTQKYVALFPNQESTSADGAEKTEDSSTSQERANKVKERIVQSMKKGELSNEPEMELESRTKEDVQTSRPTKRAFGEEEVSSDKKKAKGKKQKQEKSNLKDDDFFAAGDE
jgi:hypothetical protein